MRSLFELLDSTYFVNFNNEVICEGDQVLSTQNLDNWWTIEQIDNKKVVSSVRDTNDQSIFLSLDRAKQILISRKIQHDDS